MKKEHEIFLSHFRENEQIVIEGHNWKSHGYIYDADEDGIWLYQLKNSTAKLYPWNRFIIARDPCIWVKNLSTAEASDIFTIEIKSHQERVVKNVMNFALSRIYEPEEKFVVKCQEDQMLHKIALMSTLEEIERRYRGYSDERIPLDDKNTKFLDTDVYLNFDFNGVDLKGKIRCREDFESEDHFGNQTYILDKTRNKVERVLRWELHYWFHTDSINRLVLVEREGGYKLCRSDYVDKGGILFADVNTDKQLKKYLKIGPEKFLEKFGERLPLRSYGDPLLVEDTKLIDLHMYDIPNGAKMFVSPHAEMYM